MNESSVINGYRITVTGSFPNLKLRIEEIPEEKSKSWQAMLEFAKRFPSGYESEWDNFIAKQSAMQRSEIERAKETFLQQKWEGLL